ncbi:dihydrouridine synthase family protein, partial [Vibrio parahaemolyticus V-223/04]
SNGSLTCANLTQKLTSYSAKSEHLIKQHRLLSTSSATAMNSNRVKAKWLKHSTCTNCA